MIMTPFRKYLYFYLLLLLIVVIFFASLVYLVDVRAVHRHENLFNKQQLLQTLLVKKTIQQLIDSEMSAAKAIFNNSKVSESSDSLGIEQKFDFLRNIESSVAAVFDVSQSGEILREMHADDFPVHEMTGIVKNWSKKYGQGINDAAEQVVPPFYITQEYQYMGTVFRRLDEQKPGCIIVVMDLHSIFVQYIGLLKSGQYGSGYALDERGVILFDRETEIIGRSIFDGMHDAFPEVEALDKRIIAEDTGMANYAFTITRGQKVYRKLVAWNTVKFKGRKIIVALSAPDTEINATLEELRNFYIMLGGVLALLLATITLKLLRRKQHLELLEVSSVSKELSNPPGKAFSFTRMVTSAW